ncbi:MAG: DUF2909 domain-containing protein [Gammaproteobacteria bacterium]|nr:DUF2909 domain-containing protein [Gammaproteobacteria bacterium]
MYKILIITLLVLAIASLASALFVMFNTNINRKEMARALSFRVGFSMILFGLLFLGAYMGWIVPHGLYPVTAQ